ncbi:FAD-dependent oxidoreductase [Candidatus Babeliales bacterium]|nr:FAD-dependent oxidoreductase [Candidatus Babeliales bacterium]
MAKIVIIGAGPTGLSAAYHLEKKGFFDYKIFEKERMPGGLCRSIQQDGFTFDFTGHLLHVNNPYFSSFLEKLVGFHNLNSITRRSFIYSHGTYTRYPFQSNLFGLPDEVIVDCIEGYATRKKKKTQNKSFHEWVLENFGNGMGKHFFFPYQKKIFSYDLHKISAAWTGRFVPKTTLRDIIRGSLRDMHAASVGYNANFFYPKTEGISFWVNQIAQQLESPIYTDFCVEEIDVSQKCITFTNGHTEHYEHLITTMPLDRLIHSLKESSAMHLEPAANKLLCNKVVNFNLGIAHADVSSKHWIYYPEQHYPFYRIGFYHNFAESLVPYGHSSLYGELAYLNETPKQITAKVRRSIKEAKKVLGINSRDIATEAILPIEHAYVIYDFWREKHLPKIHATLHDHQIHSIGRYGEWKYASMQESVLDGKAVIDRLLIIPAQQVSYTHTMYDTQQEYEVQ